MVRSYKRKSPARRYAPYTKKNLDAAVQAVQNCDMTYKQAHVKYNVSVGTIYNHIKGKHLKKPGHPSVFTELEEQSFVDHLITSAEWGCPFDTMVLSLFASAYLRNVEKSRYSVPKQHTF